MKGRDNLKGGHGPAEEDLGPAEHPACAGATTLARERALAGGAEALQVGAAHEEVE